MKNIAIGVISCALAVSAFASPESIQTGRYTQVKNTASAEQLNPLRVVVKTRIPQSVNTVRETVEFLLLRSGYQLVDDVALSDEGKTLLNHDLPEIHRELGPMTLDHALKVIAGEAFELIVDPVHRKVTYELPANLSKGQS